MYKRLLLLSLVTSGLFVSAQSRMVPHVTPLEGAFSTGFVLMNPTDSELTFQLTPFSIDGMPLDPIEGVLMPLETRTLTTHALFGQEISHFFIEDDNPIEIVIAYRDASQLGSSAHITPQTAQARRWRVPPGELGDVLDGIAVVNLDENQMPIWVRQVGADGLEIDRFNILNLDSNAKGLYLFQDFSSIQGAYFDIFSEALMSITALRFSTGADLYFWETAAIALPALVEVVNQVPQITGQASLSTNADTPLTITLTHLTIVDPDNSSPPIFSLTVGAGLNYEVSGTTITPDSGFTGWLSLPVTVSDDQDTSDVYMLSVEVIGTDPRIGRIADFRSNSTYGVSGRAVISDERTITLENFNYNGMGPDVRIYLGLNGDYANGIDLSGLISGSPQNNATLTYELPANMTLDDFNGISVWCTIFLIDFSSGTFQDSE